MLTLLTPGCLLYQDISAGGREPQETHLRLYSRPATMGWSSVIILTPRGGTRRGTRDWTVSQFSQF